MNKIEKQFKLKKIREFSEEVYQQVMNKEITFLEGYNQMMASVYVTTSFAGKGTRHKDKKKNKDKDKKQQK